MVPYSKMLSPPYVSLPPLSLLPFAGLFFLASCKGLDVVPTFSVDECPVYGDANGASASSREAVVARTLDGDTFETEDGETIRLLGVNAPEIEHPDQAEECWGPEAAAWAAETLTGQTVRLGFDKTCTDTYGRTLAYVWTVGDPETTDDDVLINEDVVRVGAARVYEDFDDIKLAPVLYDAEAVAQRGEAGLWGVCES